MALLVAHIRHGGVYRFASVAVIRGVVPSLVRTPNMSAASRLRSLSRDGTIQYHGGLLLGIILLIQCYYLPSGNPFKCLDEVLSLQPIIPPKRFGIPPPDWGMLRRSRCVQGFLYARAINIMDPY